MAKIAGSIPVGSARKEVMIMSPAGESPVLVSPVGLEEVDLLHTSIRR